MSIMTMVGRDLPVLLVNMLFLLNLYWFSIMLRQVFKMLSGQKNDEEHKE